MNKGLSSSFADWRAVLKDSGKSGNSILKLFNFSGSNTEMK